MADQQLADAGNPTASIQLQPSSISTRDPTTDGVHLEMPAEQAPPATTTASVTTDPSQRTWWEWMVMNVTSLGESLNPSYEYGKRPPPPAPTVPQGAVSVPMPRALSGAPAEGHKSAATRNKTALLLRAFEGHPPSGQHQPPETTACS